MGREHNSTEYSKEAKKSRRSAIRIAKKLGLEKKCVECESTEELELDHKDNDPFNNVVTNLRYLCKRCHMAHHSGLRKTEDFNRCSKCLKLRVCAPSPISKHNMCSACFIKQCKENDLYQHHRYEEFGNDTLYGLWCKGRPKYRSNLK